MRKSDHANLRFLNMCLIFHYHHKAIKNHPGELTTVSARRKPPLRAVANKKSHTELHNQYGVLVCTVLVAGLQKRRYNTAGHPSAALARGVLAYFQVFFVY